MSDTPEYITHLITDAIRVLVNISYHNSKNHGFWENYDQTCEALVAKGRTDLAADYIVITKLAKMALIHSEVGEATEGIRKYQLDGHCPNFTSEEVELADALIRIFDYAGKFKLRLPEALLAKITYNKSRPFKHGKAA